MKGTNCNYRKSEIIYTGAFDLNDGGKLISFEINSNKYLIDLSVLIESNIATFKNLCQDEILELCNLAQIICTIYPNGNISFRKLNSKNELNSVYCKTVISEKVNYLIIIAFDEIQPGLYTAEFIAVLEKDMKIRGIL